MLLRLDLLCAKTDMPKIAINLLPEEFISSRIKEMKFYKLQTFGVAVTLFLVFLSSLTVALRILQHQRIDQVQKQLETAQQKVLSFKDIEVTLMVLKNRLTDIDKYIGTASLQSELYNLVNAILPSSVSISSLVIDRSGQITISAVIPDSSSLDTVTTNLLDKSNSGLTQVSIDSLSRGRNGAFRINLNIKSK